VERVTYETFAALEITALISWMPRFKVCRRTKTLAGMPSTLRKGRRDRSMGRVQELSLFRRQDFLYRQLQRLFA
jgi:hypothetical protein